MEVPLEITLKNPRMNSWIPRKKILEILKELLKESKKYLKKFNEKSWMNLRRNPWKQFLKNLEEYSRKILLEFLISSIYTKKKQFWNISECFHKGNAGGFFFFENKEHKVTPRDIPKEKSLYSWLHVYANSLKNPWKKIWRNFWMIFLKIFNEFLKEYMK